MNKNLVFLYSNTEDPVVKIAREAFESRENVKFIPLNRLLKYLGPTDWPVVLKSRYPDDLLGQFEGAIVVNRIFELDPALTRSELVQDSAHELWIHLALAPLLNQSELLVHDVGTRGVSRTLLPLNTQWYFVSDKGTNGVAVPTFSFAFGAEAPDLSMINTPFQKSIWSIFDWKKERHLLNSERDWHRFFVETPVGTPFVIHFLDNHVWVSFPRGEKVPVNVSWLKQVTEIVQLKFRSEIGEILCFKENDDTHRYYAFAPHMLVASDTPEFSDRLKLWISHKLTLLTPEIA